MCLTIGNTDITNEPNNSEDEPTGIIEITESVDDLDVKLTKFREKRKQELEEDIKKERARLSIDKFNKYSYRWFVEKLKYESWESSKEQNHDDKYAIRLIFQKFHPDNNSKRIFIFEDTTRDIPNWIEELNTIPIEFYFDHSETVHIDFEAASVTGDKLRVKATPTDVERISDFDIDSFTKATIKLNNPLNIEKKFFQAFKSFNYEDNFDMQENLNGNIRFIFGPPGTGKTTKISKSEILPLMEGEEPCKILVLTPTNKACDVLTRRILTDCGNEIPEWLGRFVITSDEDIDNASLVCDRNSKLPADAPYQIVDRWNVNMQTSWRVRPRPHIEDKDTTFISLINNVGINGIKQYINTHHLGNRLVSGDISYAFEGCLHFEGTKNYINRDRIPCFSTQFWITDRDLIHCVSFDKHYYMYGNHRIKFVGFQECIERIPAGTIIRLSLANWWDGDGSGVDRCYLQLSGWYL